MNANVYGVYNYCHRRKQLVIVYQRSTQEFLRLAKTININTMSKVYQFWFTIAMTNYEKIYDFAVDNYYLITSKQAKKLGVPNIELVKLAKRGKLIHAGQGLYRLTKYVPSENDSYAYYVKLVDEDSWLHGESVLAMLNLCPTNPKITHIATTKRIRKNLPQNINIIKAADGQSTIYYEGIRIQAVNKAIETCIGNILPDRIQLAIRNAQTQGYITKQQATKLRKLNDKAD